MPRICPCMTRQAVRRSWSAESNRCYLCDAPAEHSDHLLALANGGWHCQANLRPACRRCNLAKGYRRTQVEFVALLATRGVPVQPDALAPGLPCPYARARSKEPPCPSLLLAAAAPGPSSPSTHSAHVATAARSPR